MFYCQAVDKGLGQLEVYAEQQEGVAFQMDNGMFWNSFGDDNLFGIQAADEKSHSSKFFVTVTGAGKVALRDCRGWYLAPKLLGESQTIYTLHPMHRKPQVSSELKVFHKGNKVAFQTYDGCFLAKVFRGVFVVEASKTTVDSSCFFQPQIGDLLAPDYKVINVMLGDLSKLRCKPCVLKKETHVNRSEVLANHTFTLTWAEEGMQTTVWTHRWGLGLVTTAPFTIRDTKATLKYNKDNDQVVSLPQIISETFVEKVELPPKTKATAQLLVHKQDNVAVPFKARIRKLRPGGTVLGFVEPGVWKGLVYYGLKVEVKVEPLRIPCATM